MGGLASKEKPDLLGDVDDMKSLSSDLYSSNCQHILPYELDPRSPTTGIERTPIQLPMQPTASLDLRSPSDAIQTQVTNENMDILLDPRSPTLGIERTPIQVQIVKTQPATLQDPRSPTVGIDRTPIVCFASESERTGEDACIPCDVPPTTDDATEGPAPTNDDALDESASKGAIPFDLESADAPLDNLIPPMALTTNDVPYSSKPVSDVVVKSKSLHDPTANCSPGGRSPLAPFNYALPSRTGSDTPRGIVQRKQALRVEKMRNNANSSLVGRGQGQFQLYCDKENI